MATSDALTRGRAAFERKAWSEACRQLRRADRDAPLDPEDLDHLATAAYLIGEESVSAEIRGRAHASFLVVGQGRGFHNGTRRGSRQRHTPS